MPLSLSSSSFLLNQNFTHINIIPIDIFYKQFAQHLSRQAHPPVPFSFSFFLSSVGLGDCFLFQSLLLAYLEASLHYVYFSCGYTMRHMIHNPSHMDPLCRKIIQESHHFCDGGFLAGFFAFLSSELGLNFSSCLNIIIFWSFNYLNFQSCFNLPCFQFFQLLFLVINHSHISYKGPSIISLPNIQSIKMDREKFNNDLFEGNKGKVMLQLSKTYKGDSRFKLDQRFKDDIEVDKLPQKFRDIAEKGVIEAIEKKKKIKKDKPLIVQRFEPGTVKAESMIKKAEGLKKFEQSKRRHEQKIKKKEKNQVFKGIDKAKKGQLLLKSSNNDNQNEQEPIRPKFKITVNGNRKQAFKQKQFKLFE